MGKVTSIRGVQVDFDLLKIRQELMAISPDPVVVERTQAIEDSIKKRREQRRLQRLQQQEKNKKDEQDLELVEKTSVIKENRKTKILSSENENE